MRRSAALLCFILWLFNAALCQLEAGDRLARLLDELHEPCDFERACGLRACSPPYCGVLKPQSTPRLFLDDAEPFSFASAALLSVQGGLVSAPRIHATDDRSLRARAGFHQQRRAWLQVFLC